MSTAEGGKPVEREREHFWIWALSQYCHWFNPHQHVLPQYEEDADLAWEAWRAASTPEAAALPNKPICGYQWMFCGRLATCQEPPGHHAVRNGIPGSSHKCQYELTVEAAALSEDRELEAFKEYWRSLPGYGTGLADAGSEMKARHAWMARAALSPSGEQGRSDALNEGEKSDGTRSSDDLRNSSTDDGLRKPSTKVGGPQEPREH